MKRKQIELSDDEQTEETSPSSRNVEAKHHHLNSDSIINTLPIELICECLSYVTIFDLYSWTRVCKLFNDILSATYAKNNLPILLRSVRHMKPICESTGRRTVKCTQVYVIPDITEITKLYFIDLIHPNSTTYTTNTVILHRLIPERCHLCNCIRRKWLLKKGISGGTITCKDNIASAKELLRRLCRYKYSTILDIGYDRRVVRLFSYIIPRSIINDYINRYITQRCKVFERILNETKLKLYKIRDNIVSRNI